MKSMTTKVYSDPSMVKDDDIGYFVDMYSFGMIMLVLLGEDKDIVGMLGRARKIVDKRDVSAIKSFLKKDLDYDVIYIFKMIKWF